MTPRSRNNPTPQAFIDRKIIEPAQRRDAALAGGGGGARKAGGKKKKPKGSFAENFEVLKGSAKIRNLALLVMGYGVAHRWEALDLRSVF
jgi:ATP/ADP translocase